MTSFLLTFAVVIVWATFAFLALTEPKTRNFQSHFQVILSLIDLTRQRLSRLSRLPPIFYIIAYIGQIILFAATYWLLPHRSFYHVTAMYERGPFSEDARQILADIRRVIVDSSVKAHGTSVVTLDGWTIDINSIQVHSIDIANFPEEVSFNIGTSSWYTFSDGQLAQSNEQAKITMRIYGNRIIADNMVILPMTIEERTFPEIKDILTKPSIDKFLMFGDSSIFDTNMNRQEFSTIFLPPDLYLRINSFGEGYRGFPTGVSGQLMRMLYLMYLSAGIATSNAFGDIVPITTVARVFVFVQALITILLVGFFLNAVGQSIAQTKSDSIR